MISASANANSYHLEQMHHPKASPTSSTSSSRILDIPCKVCGDFSSGKHYNIFACDGCAGFFKRSIRRNRQYVCKAKFEGSCTVDKTHRNQCRACRLAKCQEAGMNKDAVQHERGPRNSTLRRQQLAQFFDPRDRLMISTSTGALDLAVPKPGSTPPTMLEQTMLSSQSFLSAVHRLPMHLPPATPLLHPMLNPAAICESAARLLFMNVKWTKNVPSFVTLPMQDQLVLLEHSWRELFILGASQFLPRIELTAMVHACGYLERFPEKARLFLQDVKEFQDTLLKIGQFHLDLHEFACLRAIVLFKTNLEAIVSGCTLRDPAAVAAVQEHTQMTLNKYLQCKDPGQPLRFGKLMMLLPTLRNVPCDVIEELFFRKTIGHIPIVRIICDMYKSSTPDTL